MRFARTLTLTIGFAQIPFLLLSGAIYDSTAAYTIHYGRYLASLISLVGIDDASCYKGHTAGPSSPAPPTAATINAFTQRTRLLLKHNLN